MDNPNSINDRIYLAIRSMRQLTFCFIAGVSLSAYLLIAMMAHLQQHPINSINAVVELMMYFIFPIGIALTAGIVSMRRQCRLVCRLDK